jgi:ketosteroid isomerase-like protein
MAEAAMAPSNAALIKSGYDAFARGDLQGAFAVFAEDILWHVPGRGPLSRDYRGHDECWDFSSTSWNYPTARSAFRLTTSWPRLTEWSCSAPRVRSAAVEAGPHRRSTFGRSKMDEPPSSGSTRAISRPKTSSGRRRSNQKVGRSLRKARRSASLTGQVPTGTRGSVTKR